MKHAKQEPCARPGETVYEVPYRHGQHYPNGTKLVGDVAKRARITVSTKDARIPADAVIVSRN